MTLSVSDVALMAHEAWPVPEPFRLPPLSFHINRLYGPEGVDVEWTRETKEIMAQEFVRGVLRGESLDVVSSRIDREVKRQIDEYFRKLNNMLHHGTYEDKTE